MIITADQLLKASPGASRATLDAFVPFLNAALERWKISDRTEVAAFLANVLHESANFTRLREGMNYSAVGLAATWPKRFSATGRPGGAPNPKALSLHRKPEAIANYVYAGRMGNGDESTGDGWKHRGAGLIQLTGRDAHRECSLALHGDLRIVENPDLLAQPADAANSAGWFWTSQGIGKWLRQNPPSFDRACDCINFGRPTEAIGDAIGYAERKAIFERALSAIPAQPKKGWF